MTPPSRGPAHKKIATVAVTAAAAAAFAAYRSSRRTAALHDGNIARTHLARRDAHTVTAAPVTASTAVVDHGNELSWVSWLRVLAIAAVIFIHIGGQSAVAQNAHSTAVGRVGIVLDFSSRWAVPVFVMVSGALLLDAARYRDTLHFLRRRSLRLVPAVIGWHAIYLVYILYIQDRTLSVHEITALIMTGRLFTALYFFWIVLGLALITPLLIPWVASSSRRTQIIIGLTACAIPALSLATAPLRGLDWRADVSWVQTPWTWFIPYIGYYLLGFALRDIVLASWRLLTACAVVAGGTVLLILQWGRTDGPLGWLEIHAPAEAYYGPVVIAVSLGVFLIARAMIRPKGVLRFLQRPLLARIGRRLGDATLGVFGVHLLVLEWTYTLPHIGGAAASGSIEQLLARCGFVFVVAYAISLLALRIPLLRRIF